MDKIGRYIIEGKLGQGGMGIVYRCSDPDSQQVAAIKVLPQQLAADPAFLQRFKREVTTLRRLEHPSIVRILDQGESDGAYYYAMEFVEGTSLEALLTEEHKLPPLRAIQVCREIAVALDHSHSQGVVHRDLKPANILFTADGRVKLTDFGIAKVLDATRMTATQGVLGTVEYMSPEQSQGRHVDARSDLYSLGVLLYRCLTGRLPLTGNTPTEIIMKLRTHQVDPPTSWEPTLPKSVDDLVMRLLEKEPARRIESAKELVRELDRVEKHIRTGITGRAPAVQAEPIIVSSPQTGAGWMLRWLLIGGVFIIGIGLWGMLQTRNTVPPETPAESLEPGDARARALYRTAKRAFDDNQLDESFAICQVVLRHHAGTATAADAEKLIIDINYKRADLARQTTTTTLRPPG